jgi:iduronate 2-sulfatase
MSSFRLCAATVCAAILPAGVVDLARAAQPVARPNVLFIAVDDLNNRLGCYGHEVRTPHIDRLAAMGRRFDRAYCQYPVCNPSRASVMSGRRPETTQVLSNTEPPRPRIEHAPPLQEHFRANGYFTARVGKIYHSPFERDFVWDSSENSPAQAARFDRAGREAGRRDAGADGPRRQGRPLDRPARSAPRERTGGRPPAAGERDPRDPAPLGAPGAAEPEQPGAAVQQDGVRNPMSWQISERPDEQEPDGAIARRVARLIEENADRPFFIAAGFHKPHQPWIAPRRYFEMYPPERIVLFPDPSGHLDSIPSIAFSTAMARGLPEEERRRNIAAYYACVSFIDAQVGILLEALQKARLVDNTIIIFWSDHGFQLGEHGGLWGKAALFEESARVPLIIAAPRLERRGAATGALVELVDLYPTLVELCGLPPVEGLEGASLVPLLKDPERKVKDAAFTVVSRGPGRLGDSIRTERHRYTEWPDGSTELYEFGDDPAEYRNLAGDPSREELVARLKEELRSEKQ